MSNAVFYADEEFLAALPSQDRIGFPTVYAGRAVGPGTDPVLGHGLWAAEELDPRLTLVTGAMDVLRSTAPAERSETHRVWDPRTLAAPVDAEADTWWIRADLTRAAPGADILWRLEGARGADGPWVEVGSGRHDPSGVGDLTWDLAAMDALLGWALGERLEVDYRDATADDPSRSVAIRLPDGFGAGREYAFEGVDRFGWSGSFAFGEGPAEPGAAVVALLADGSGRGEGAVLREGGTTPFAACWAGDGARVWGEGPDAGPEGDPGACALDALE